MLKKKRKIKENILFIKNNNFMCNVSIIVCVKLFNNCIAYRNMGLCILRNTFLFQPPSNPTFVFSHQLLRSYYCLINIKVSIMIAIWLQLHVMNDVSLIQKRYMFHIICVCVVTIYLSV